MLMLKSLAVKNCKKFWTRAIYFSYSLVVGSILERMYFQKRTSPSRRWNEISATKRRNFNGLERIGIFTNSECATIDDWNYVMGSWQGRSQLAGGQFPSPPGKVICPPNEHIFLLEGSEEGSILPAMHLIFPLRNVICLPPSILP